MTRWRLPLAAIALLALVFGCASPLEGPTSGGAGSRAAASSLTLTGPNGTVTVSGMSGTNLTVSYAPSSAITWAKLYVTQGNGLGLVLASQAMTNTSGTWSYTFSNSTFTSGAKIALDVLQLANGVESSVPQGALGDASTWASFTYASSVTSSVVTFDSQGATVAASPTSITVTSPATTVASLPTPPSKTGYTFAGWYTGANGTGTAFTATTPVTASLTAYAFWQSNSNQITLTGVNGSVVLSGMTASSLTVSYTPVSAITSANLYVTQGNGTGLILAAQAMAKSGSTWTYTLSNPSFVPGAKIALDVLQLANGVETNVPQGTLANATSWASFSYPSTTVTSSTVTFDSQGATVAASPATITVTSPATTVGALPTPPTKTGSTFGGWFTGTNGTGTAFTATTTVTTSLTVFAKWNTSTTTYAVAFDSQGATVAANPSSIVVTSPATTVGSLPAPPTKSGFSFSGWFTGTNGTGSAFTATTIVTANITVYAKWSSTVLDFGPNVIIFDPTMSSASIQSQVDAVYTSQRTNQFGSNRYALVFKPGTYNVNVNVGFYTQVLGLGTSPDNTNIVGSIQADGSWDPNYNVTENFWRAVENIAVTPTAQSYNMWAVSQAAPMRRVHVKGGLWLFNVNPNTGASGWASGGFLSDTLVDGQVNSGGQQQWLSRNAQWGSWTGSVWNMVFAGAVNAPANTFPNPPNTTIAQVPAVKEKPFLTIDTSGNYAVFVPSMRTNSQGISWASGSSPGTSIPISQFYVAKSSVDNAASLNAALGAGKHLLLTPGIYSLNDTLRVTNANTVVLGLGMATLLNTTAAPAMTIADVDGVEVSGVLFDAGPINSPYQLQVGPTGSSSSHSANPTVLHDLFFRVGGAAAGSTSVSVQINSNNVIGDDFWIWRADHGSSSAAFGWTVNPAANGIVVNGNNVTIYGLAVEHYQQYQTLWNGNGGKVYFYQSEEPYDVPSQAAWMNGSAKGYPSYKVADTVTSHSAYGVGVYCFFNLTPTVQLDNAFEVPASGLNGGMLHDLLTVSLGGVGTINHIVNGLGATVNSASNNAYLVQ